MPGKEYKQLLDKLNERRKQKGIEPMSWVEFMSGKKPKKDQEPNRRAEIDPISGRMIYRKGNPGPEKPSINRPPCDYSNPQPEDIYKKYGV